MTSAVRPARDASVGRISRVVVVAVAAALVLTGCATNGGDPSATAAGDDPPPTGAPGSGAPQLDVVDAATIDGAVGGTVAAAGVTVTLPAAASASDLDVEIRSPIPVDEHEIAGAVVAVDHPSPIVAPLVVEWDVSALTPAQQSAVMLVRWDDTARAWLVEDQPFDVVDGTLRSSITNWSFWGWITNVGATGSQELQELIGRRKDPPTCNHGAPGWVNGFVDPDADTSAAAVLVCIEDDPGDASRLTMRIVNNRTTGQIVHVGGDEPVAWVWEGEVPSNVAGAVQTAAGSVLTTARQVFVPPLHEIAVGIQRPGTPGTKHVELSAEITASTILADVIAFGAGHAHVGGAFEDPMLAIFFELVLECGISEVVAWRGDAGEIASSIVSALASCVQVITTHDTELGRRFQLRVSERIVEHGSPAAARNAMKANRILHTIARYLAALTVVEVTGYVADVILDAWVEAGGGPLVWSLNLTGQPQNPGAWTPTCSDVVADQQGWSRNWVTQPVFNQPPLRDFHAYGEFPGIITAATAPLGTCSVEHVRAVRDEIAEVGFQTAEAGAIAIAIVDELISSMAGAPTGPDIESCRGDAYFDAEFAFDPNFVVGCLLAAWTAGDRDLAERYAEPTVIDVLFGIGTGGGWTFVGCTPRDDQVWPSCTLAPPAGATGSQQVVLVFTAYDDGLVVGEAR